MADSVLIAEALVYSQYLKSTLDSHKPGDLLPTAAPEHSLMPSETQDESLWDFSFVRSLLQTLSTQRATPALQLSVDPVDQPLKKRGHDDDSSGTHLGDFSKIFDSIQPADETSLKGSQPSSKKNTKSKNKKKRKGKDRDTAYTSDGNIYYPASSKVKEWVEDSNKPEVADTQPETQDDSPPGTGLIDQMVSKTTRRVSNRYRISSAGKRTPIRHSSDESEELLAEAQVEEMGTLDEQTSSFKAANSLLRPSQVTPVPEQAKPVTVESSDLNKILPQPLEVAKQWPVANPAADRARTSQVVGIPTPKSTTIAVRFAVDGAKNSSASKPIAVPNASTTPSKHRRIAPLTNTTALDRNWGLLTKLMRNFPDERETLLAPFQLTIDRTDGIHVFIDASNITIGFSETLKRARGISPHQSIDHVEMDFFALALLLERRRKITKRVVVGSHGKMGSFWQDAKDIGYETSVLDRVYKAKELTKRQRFFQGLDNGYQSDANAKAGWPSSSGYSSAATAAAVAAVAAVGGPSAAQTPPKWIEQGVDEILHMKILESIVDVALTRQTAGLGSSPSKTQADRPTMVIATGDAAEAEYSPGFFKNILRALQDGWNVELIAWACSISEQYKRMAKTPVSRGGWGADRFKIIHLDPYAEELFGQSVE